MPGLSKDRMAGRIGKGFVISNNAFLHGGADLHAYLVVVQTIGGTSRRG
jgi:hypothetical protein